MNNMSLDDITKASVADVAKFIKEHNAFLGGIDREQTKGINKYAQAMKFLGYQEGLKKGISIGSHQAYNHFLKQGHWEDKIPYEDAKHGRWIFKGNGNADCSCCGYRSSRVYDDDNADRYCRHCGAKMDGKEE